MASFLRLGVLSALREGETAGEKYALISPNRLSKGISGSRLGNNPGSSLEFLDHREYQPGDDLRQVDWSAFARSDRLIVKLFQEEISPHLDIVLDGSRSMTLEDTEKCRATLGIAALCAQSARNSGFTHSVWITKPEGFHRVPNGGDRPSNWENLSFDNTGSPFDSFAHLPPSWRPKGIRFFITDCLWPGDPLGMLRHLSDKAAFCVVVQVLARADVSAPERGNVQLIDSETSQVLDVAVDENIEKKYLEAFSAHQETWRTAAKQTGTFFSTLIAEEVVPKHAPGAPPGEEATFWRLDELVRCGILMVR